MSKAYIPALDFQETPVAHCENKMETKKSGNTACVLTIQTVSSFISSVPLLAFKGLSLIRSHSQQMNLLIVLSVSNQLPGSLNPVHGTPSGTG